MSEPGSRARLSELLAALSLGIDLGMGHPMEHVLRQSFLALRLADRLGLPAEQRQVVHYSSPLATIGRAPDERAPSGDHTVGAWRRPTSMTRWPRPSSGASSSRSPGLG